MYSHNNKELKKVYHWGVEELLIKLGGNTQLYVIQKSFCPQHNLKIEAYAILRRLNQSKMEILSMRL